MGSSDDLEFNSPAIPTNPQVQNEVHSFRRDLDRPRGCQGHHQVPTCYCRGSTRQAHEEPQPLGRQLLPPKEGCYQHRIAPRCPKERRYPPHSPNPHQQPDHRCHQGLQVQDEICLRTFPHQRQRRQELRDWSCNQVSRSSHQRTRRMSYNCSVTRSRTSHSPPPTSSKSAECETRISGSSWTVCTFRRRATSRKTHERFGLGNFFLRT